MFGRLYAAGDLVKSELQGYLNGMITPTPQRVDTGSYRKVQPSELALTERLSAERIEWLCRHLGASGWIHFYDSSGEKSYSVSRFIHRIGRRAQAPRISRYAIEFDASDARVRVARHVPGLRELGSCLVAIARTTLALSGLSWCLRRSAQARLDARCQE